MRDLFGDGSSVSAGAVPSDPAGSCGQACGASIIISKVESISLQNPPLPSAALADRGGGGGWIQQ